MLTAVGSYADVYERNLGAASGLDVPRGPNELWTRGGLHYAVPCTDPPSAAEGAEGA